MSTIRRAAFAVLFAPLPLLAQFRAEPLGTGPIKVGPEHGTVLVVGGGAQGPEVYAAFMAAAGGPDAQIIYVPNADGKASYDQTAAGARGLRAAGMKNVYTLFTKDRTVADADSFVAIIKKAGGVWFEGGRQFHLVEDYAGTKTQAAFMDVLTRGGVVGGSSAGASILGDFMVRGAPSNDNFIMDYTADPKYEKGFAYLRNVGVDQHVVARERLRDLADSIIPKYPNLLGISEDEGTAWLIKGDTARVIGRDKAFVYGGKDATDPGNPFITLHPGDTYNLSTRHVMHRAVDDSPVSLAFINPLFSKYENPAAGGATVLVARAGEVLIDRAFGIPAQAKYMPTTTVPLFDVGTISVVFTSICDQLAAQPARGGRGGGAPDSAAAGRAAGAGGAATGAATATGTATTGANAAAAGAGAAPAGGGRGGRGGRGGVPRTPFETCVDDMGRISSPTGTHKTMATPQGQVHSDVDELYRLAIGLDVPTTFRGVDYTKGWTADTRNGVARLTAYGADGGKRAAFVRLPDQHAAIIILTNDDAADAKGIADKITDKLMSDAKKH